MTKYKAVKTECLHGHTHDSKIEAKRCNDLHVMEIAGTITDLIQQPEYRCEVNGKHICTYRADFLYCVQGLLVTEDVKGISTPVFNLKRKLVEALYPDILISIYPPVKRKVRKAKAKS